MGSLPTPACPFNKRLSRSNVMYELMKAFCFSHTSTDSMIFSTQIAYLSLEH